ncbi:hypothetical protein SAMN05446037_103434 [Anaerovirgula multivorans]|uniref:Uncharacterized protein n=1 Tax=Anaerovirgula multivorans TaxID=312168 RepID=A0A239JB21_9FIRM|nr:hypothetical protein [Anaerovirgula multivorans]SNT03015.1 hypothetical protein SAMN05446037_103434 [Anaerovirgula multivorans]
MTNLGNEEQSTKTSEKKKISLQEAMKQMLATKNQEKSNGKSRSNSFNANTSKQSQLAKKTNNQRRKTGGA